MQELNGSSLRIAIQSDRPDGSYTADLLAAGRARVAEKLGEEALETAIAARRAAG